MKLINKKKVIFLLSGKGSNLLTILKKIRDDEVLQEVPVIIFSNLSEEKDIEKATALGISEFMVKSNFTLDELADKIKVLIG